MLYFAAVILIFYQRVLKLFPYSPDHIKNKIVESIWEICRFDRKIQVPEIEIFNKYIFHNFFYFSSTTNSMRYF